MPELPDVEVFKRYLNATSLHKIIEKVLRTAVRAKADPDAFPKGFLIRNRGKNRNCPRCGGRIEKVTVSVRRGYACPNCQA